MFLFQMQRYLSCPLRLPLTTTDWTKFVHMAPILFHMPLYLPPSSKGRITVRVKTFHPGLSSNSCTLEEPIRLEDEAGGPMLKRFRYSLAKTSVVDLELSDRGRQLAIKKWMQRSRGIKVGRTVN